MKRHTNKVKFCEEINNCGTGKFKKTIYRSLIFLAFIFIIALPISFKCVDATLDITCTVSAVTEQTQDEETAQAEKAEKGFDWSQWFNDKCLPVLIAVGTSIVAICSFLYPVLNAVNGGVKLFKGSKDNFESVTNKVVESQQQITEFKETKNEMEQGVASIAEKSEKRIDEIDAEMRRTFDKFAAELQDLLAQVENQIKVMKIAFGNNAELVKNGYANEIMKIGVSDGSEKVEEKDNIDANS